ncbi:DNA sulfur modification protein DndD [Jiangella alkaliphila]|uniref:Nuclease SbcCD subunit C n=1 Tax=Jiangella alkaliphila TaxID=419479 RepID=A0A1H2IVZ9_9ACTN|nr:DNA sulfur modification protein DndD [Jiangella alkaliphila]SDU48171.1 DNA sulfur modification protein DndD [Jiangella alkaliphila]
MILDKLVLNNVGTFAGRHELVLTPDSTRGPIVLIGGLNGAGKTTVLETIHLALYGSLARSSTRRSGGYEWYLRSLIHNGVPRNEGAMVELTFHTHQHGDVHEYRVRRSWRSAGSSTREDLQVWLDGQPDDALTSTWGQYVETFLPRGIAGLFFFDGEQIEALADMDRSQQVLSSALAALLGLDLIDRLATDLSVLRRRHRGRQVPEELRKAIEDRQRVATSARQAEESAAGGVAATRVEDERASKRLFEVRERYRSAGGDLLDQREAAETKVNLLRGQLTELEDELREEAAGIAPLLQAQTLLAGLVTQAGRETKAQQARLLADVVAKRDQALLDVLKSTLANARTVEAVEQFLTRDRMDWQSSTEAPSIVAVRDNAHVEFLHSSALPTAQRRLASVLERRQALHSALDQAERLLIAIPDPESLATLRAELDAAATRTNHTRAALAQAEERLAALRHERAKADTAYEAAMDKAADANLAADDDRRLVEHVDRVQRTLDALRAAAARRHVDRISDLIHEALTRLLRKDRLITAVKIDATTQTVELTGRNGQALQAQLLSAGERQLLAVALLWGLARAAARPLPVIIDTPLGRLDGSHREHLLDRYFPHASHQVILLSTDTEIDEEAYKRIRPHVGRSYRLDFDRAANSTSVSAGYFWE